MTLQSLGPGGPDLKFELLDRKAISKEGNDEAKTDEKRPNISIIASIDEDNPNRARIAIKAPKDYLILRGELYSKGGEDNRKSE